MSLIPLAGRSVPLALLTAAVLLGGTSPRAQSAPAPFQTACTLYDVGGVAQAGPPIDLPARAARRGGAASVTTRTAGRAATFEVTYTGFTAEARAAFQAAVDVWADHVASTVPIRIDASFEDLGSGVLGAAGPNIFPDPPGAPFRNTYYAFALADALAGTDLGLGSPDIVATFNSEFDRFSFTTDGPPPAGRFDFTTVVLHELGHGLGFIGSGSVDDGAEGDGNRQECRGTAGEGCWGYYQTTTGTVSTGLPLIFDRFIEDRVGDDFLDRRIYPNPSRSLGTLLQSQDLFVAAPTVVAVNRGERAEVWAPAAFEGGSSFSHWDEVLFTRGTSAALMTPRIAPGEAYRDPGSITCAFFQDMGWRLGPGCTLLVDGGGAAAPEIAVAPSSVAFGDVPTGQSATSAVTVTNTGDADLVVSGATVPGGAAFSVSAGGGAATLAPGASRAVTVAFSPTEPGAYAAMLTVQSDDADEPAVEVALQGAGTAGTAGGAEPDALGFDGPAEVVVAPNPYRGRASVALRVREGQRVSVGVFDVLGRRVLALHDGPVRPGEPLALALEAGRLAPGAYVVRAAGERFVVSAPAVVVR